MDIKESLFCNRCSSLWPYNKDSLFLFYWNCDNPVSWYDNGFIFRSITGFTGSYGIFGFSLKKCFFASDSRYSLQSKGEINPDWLCITDSNAYSGVLPFFEELKKYNYKEIVVISDFISVAKFDSLKKLFDGSDINVKSISFANFISTLLEKIQSVNLDKKDDGEVSKSKDIADNNREKVNSELFTSIEKIEKLDTDCTPEVDRIYSISASNQSINSKCLEWISESILNMFLKQDSVETFHIPTDEVSSSFEEKRYKIMEQLKGIIEPSDTIYLANRNVTSWLTNGRNKRYSFDMNAMHDIVITQDSISVVNSLSDIKVSIKDCSKIFIDPNYTSLEKRNLMLDCKLPVHNIDYASINILSNIKGKVELENIYKSHIFDGLSIIYFLNWLELELLEDNEVSEFAASEKLLSFRKERDQFCHLSFPTISAMGENGAIVHYSKPDKNKILKDGLYLFDSGAHYFYGTTDLTRTISIGTPTAEQIFHYTIVLKAHIAVASSRFSKSLPPSYIDKKCREVMLENNMDFTHATGHGIGYFSSVHEGPISISPRSNVLLSPNMVLSNEPGYYMPGKYGIRLENVMFVVLASNADADCNLISSKNLSPILHNNNLNTETLEEKDEDILAFKTVSLVPFSRKLIDLKLLNPGEIEWIDGYHKRVFENLKGSLDRDSLIWLKNITQPISIQN